MRRNWLIGILVLLAAAAFPWPPHVLAHPGHDDEPTTRPAESVDRCLALFAENLADGPGNWLVYIEISKTPYTFQKGDHLEYDIYLPGDSPELKGGIDCDFKNKELPSEFAAHPYAREHGFVDQNKLKLHGDAILTPAKDAWYHREFDLSRLAGVEVHRWNVHFEGDKKGRYVQFIDNVRITRDGKTVFSVYENESSPEWSPRQNSGYSQKSMVATMPRAEVGDASKVGEAMARIERQFKLREAREKFRTEMDMAKKVAKESGDARLIDEVTKAAELEDAAAFDNADADKYMASLHKARHAIGHLHPMMQKYTGHLVGHAHIDLQWLWVWEESINDIIPQTFNQAVKFMDEFPEFTFSQSSATLYMATERYHPELFEKMKKKIEEGRWEIVGGRWCEGDTNMISPESHVRHFLYGQRYFQSRFGKMCTVGWEPDTFGHTWTMPQLLKKSGIDSYYFCRAGKGKPLFWWEGPDGSKVLAFEEPATGGWYNDVITDAQVKELIDFVLGTGADDHLMVYGVGNHGGGPTREHIEAALAMQDRAPWPKVKFSTASEFFKRLHAIADKLKVPTIKTELNPIFEGCYTTHSKVKRANRMSESAIEAAEVYAAMAHARAGHAYPTLVFEGLWEDVLFSHHHDTLPGSFIHAAAIYTEEMFKDVLTKTARIESNAFDRLAGAATKGLPGTQILLFNPNSWPRTEVVEVEIPVADGGTCEIVGDKGKIIPHQVLARESAGVESVKLCFLATDIPPMGMCAYGVSYRSGDGALAEKEKHADMARPFHIERIYGIREMKRDSGGPPISVLPVYKALHEKPGGMTAWQIQPYDKDEAIDKVVSEDALESGPIRWRTRRILRWDRSTIIEDTVRYAHTPRVDYEIEVEWMQVGDSKSGGTMLKAAFDTGIETPTITSEIPFGDITRPADGKEFPTLKWVDASNAAKGVTIFNDCKHGYDAKGGVIRMSLLRSSYEPDPTPDVGRHHMRLAVMPHDGPLNKAATAKAGWEFNKPIGVRVVQSSPIADSTASMGQIRWSLCGVNAPNVVVTAFKRAEDGEGWIVRAAECAGQIATATFALGIKATSVKETNLIEVDEKETKRATLKGDALTAEFTPYEIRTFRLK